MKKTKITKGRMKKAALLCLSAALAAGLLSGCAKKDAPEASAPAAQSSAAESPAAESPAADASAPADSSASPAPAPTPVAPSSNKEVVSDENAPEELYWLATDTANNLTYHLPDCPQLKGKDAQKVDWALVKTLALRQCPVCNPPQYEGYVEAE